MVEKGSRASKGEIRVLTFINVYLPGFKGGGPIRSLSNVIRSLASEVDFHVVTSDRDIGDDRPYSGLVINTWSTLAKNQVFYSTKNMGTLFRFKNILKNEPFDIIYLNSYFDLFFSILPLCLVRWIARISTPVVLAPRGEFSKGALALKYKKKRAYIKLMKLLGLYKNVVWQASSENEEEDIRETIGHDATVFIAPNIPDFGPEMERTSIKKQGLLNAVFVSRVSPKKNLLGALGMLKCVTGTVRFDIYGPIEDHEYWRKCCREISELPPNIEVSYMKELEPASVAEVFGRYDLFFFPTLGENYGHVIFESLAAGCPVLTSDQTPWHGLELNGAGWALPLNGVSEVLSVLEKLITLNEAEYVQYAEHAKAYVRQQTQKNDAVGKHLELFHSVCAQI